MKKISLVRLDVAIKNAEAAVDHAIDEAKKVDAFWILDGLRSSRGYLTAVNTLFGKMKRKKRNEDEP
jgi:hypothetical protein